MDQLTDLCNTNFEVEMKNVVKCWIFVYNLLTMKHTVFLFIDSLRMSLMSSQFPLANLDLQEP